MRSTIALCLLSLLLAFSACGKKETVTPTPTQPVKPAETTQHKDGEVVKLMDNGANAANIIILGDGFIAEDLKKGGVFDTKVSQLMDYFFTVAPFSQYKKSFNTYVVYAESAKRGAAKFYSSDNSDTKFASYFYPNIERLLVAGNTTACFDYVQKAVSLSKAHLIVLLVNDNTYGGSGGQIAVISTHQLSKYIMVHEIGHTFAGLGDEYVDPAIADNYSTAFVPQIANVDTTSNPLFVKWKQYYNLPAYKNVVGAFEGSYYRDKGFYRPEQRSVMLGLDIASYNAPSREAIARRINTITGTTFDFDAFIKADAASIQPIHATATGSQILALPKNDFINMRQRLQQLQAEKIQ